MWQVPAVTRIGDMRGEAAEYAAVGDASSRASLRARVLVLMDALDLAPGQIRVRSVTEAELRGDAVLRGAVLMHHDLVSRAPLTSFEVTFTATRGSLLVAEHPGLPGFPVGVALGLPASAPPRHRRELFDDAAPIIERADVVVLYALATNPARLGAGAALVKAARNQSRRSGRSPRLIAFSPLTGLRARVIRAVDHEAALGERPDAALLREQLSDLLALSLLPPHVPEPARAWLAAEAETFSTDPSYKVGGFHRHLGATLIGVCELADEVDSDAMWARALFEYPS
jgi:hypothetical protein